MGKENEKDKEIVLTDKEKEVIEKYFRIRMNRWWDYLLSLDPKGELSVETIELIKAGFLNGYACGKGLIKLYKEDERVKKNV